MPPISCPSCAGAVSPEAFDCPHCGHPLRRARRGPVGLLFKWLLILFNLAMLAWVVSYLADAGARLERLTTEAERAGAGLGLTLGTGFLLAIWAAGDVVLGLMVLLTRPRR